MTGPNNSGWLPRAIKGTQIDRRANLGFKSGPLLFSDLKRPIIHRFIPSNMQKVKFKKEGRNTNHESKTLMSNAIFSLMVCDT